MNLPVLNHYWQGERRQGPEAVREQQPQIQPLLAFFCAVLLCLFMLPVPPVQADATVFIYHRFGEDRYPTTNVSASAFAEQMSFLADNGYRVVPLADIVAAVRSKQSIPDKTVAITIDDGYLSTYTVAWPILKHYKFPFTVFLYAKAVDNHYRNFVSWQQVKEMAATGVDIEDHGYEHHYFGKRPKGLDDAGYQEWVRRDLAKSNTILTDRLGHKPRLCALPYGEYNTVILEAARSIGYDAVFSQDPGAVSQHTDQYSIPREPILGREWSTMGHFKEVLGRVDLPVSDQEPFFAPLTTDQPVRFGARLLSVDKYRPGSFGLYVSELGWKEASTDGDWIGIANNMQLKRRSNRVMVSAREKMTGRQAVRFWLLMQDE